MKEKPIKPVQYRRTGADYLAGRLVADAYHARLLLGELPSLSHPEQAQRLYDFVLNMAMGNSTAEKIHRSSTGAEPYTHFGVPAFNPFPIPPEIEALFDSK